MSCGHCEGRVKGELEKLGAVVENISASNGKATVSGISEDAAKNAVIAAGYKVQAINN